jgi:FkbM family methyltransferase
MQETHMNLDKYADIESQDSYIFKEIFKDNQYNVSENDIKDKIVIDVGANIGFFSILSYELGCKFSIAIEPIKKNYLQLIKNIIDYRLDKIIPVNNAVLNEIKKVYLSGDGGHAKISNIVRHTDISVSIILSDVVEKFCTDEDKIVLKIDCEGSEYEILHGMTKEVMSRFDTILLESHMRKNFSHDALINHVVSCGFKSVFKNYIFLFDSNGQPVGQPICEINKFEHVMETI